MLSGPFDDLNAENTVSNHVLKVGLGPVTDVDANVIADLDA